MMDKTDWCDDADWCFALTNRSSVPRYMRFPCGKWGSMGLYEGRLHEYFMDIGAECVTFGNDIMQMNQMDNWQNIQLPYYKHKNKAEGQASVYERWQSRVQGQEDQLLKSEDYYNVDLQKVHGTNLEPCQLNHPSYPWAT